MSLNIDTNQITAVLLADGWHAVTQQSFDLDSYEMTSNDYTVLRGGQAEPAVPATGYTFRRPDGTSLYGPLTAVLAVRTGQPKRTKPRAAIASPDLTRQLTHDEYARARQDRPMDAPDPSKDQR